MWKPRKQLDCNIKQWSWSKNTRIYIFDGPLLHATCNETPTLFNECRQPWLFYKWGKQNRNEEEQREDKMGGNVEGEKKINMRKSSGRCQAEAEQRDVVRENQWSLEDVFLTIQIRCVFLRFPCFSLAHSVYNELILLREEDSSGNSPSAEAVRGQGCVWQGVSMCVFMFGWCPFASVHADLSPAMSWC